MRYSFYPGCSYHASAGYKESVDAVCQALNIDLVDISDWNCCGATVFMGVDKVKAATLSARVFALSQKEGFAEIITGCNACFTTLKKSAHLLMEDSGLFKQVNNNLAHEGLVLEKQMQVRHLLDVFVNDIDETLYHSSCKKNTEGVRVAAYYGCQYTRPWMQTEEAENPGMLEKLIRYWGFQPIEHTAKTRCCGASLSIPHADDAQTMIDRIVRCVDKAGADLMVTICPLCQFNLDNLQQNLPGKKVPILFFTQLLGFGLGLSPAQLGLDKLLTPIRGVLSQRL